MLLGAEFVKTVPLRYELKLISPRDADTALAIFLKALIVPAVCEAPAPHLRSGLRALPMCQKEKFSTTRMG